MRETSQIVLMLAKIRKAKELYESPNISQQDALKLREFEREERLAVPNYALAHFDRIEALGTAGIAAVIDGKCSSCGTSINQDELDYLTTNNIGVCEKCFAYTYKPNPKIDLDKFFKEYLK